jgi:putative Mg2+ transporter-C (MgtC) family protein
MFKIYLLRLLVSFILGGIVGFERERKGQSAGLRTHLLVCVGSTFLMMIFIDFSESELARIATGIITGIGFLGAGTIIRAQEGVRGLTTAASIWVSCIIGIGVGLGFIAQSFVLTLITFITLSFLKLVENKIQIK